MQLIPFQRTAQDLCHVLARVPSLNFLEKELLGLQVPSIRAIGGCIYVMRGQRNIWVPWCRGPCIECKRDLGGEVLHVFTDPPLCDLCSLKDLRAQSVSVWNVLLGKPGPAELEQAAKATTLNQLESLTIIVY